MKCSAKLALEWQTLRGRKPNAKLAIVNWRRHDDWRVCRSGASCEQQDFEEAEAVGSDDTGVASIMQRKFHSRRGLLSVEKDRTV